MPPKHRHFGYFADSIIHRWAKQAQDHDQPSEVEACERNEGRGELRAACAVVQEQFQIGMKRLRPAIASGYSIATRRKPVLLASIP